MNETEALKEILRIIEFNGGIHQGQEIKVCYNSGLWRIQKLAEDALANNNSQPKCIDKLD